MSAKRWAAAMAVALVVGVAIGVGFASTAPDRPREPKTSDAVMWTPPRSVPG